MAPLEEFRGLVQEIASEMKIGFCIDDEIIQPEDFFDYDSGMPIVCLAGVNLARSLEWPQERLLIKLELDEDHPAYCSVVFNDECGDYLRAAMMSTVAMVSQGLQELSNVVEPRIEMAGKRYLAIEDIGAQIKLEQMRSAQSELSAKGGISESEMEGSIRSLERAVGVEANSQSPAPQLQTTGGTPE